MEVDLFATGADCTGLLDLAGLQKGHTGQRGAHQLVDQHREEGNDHENFVSKACYGNGHFTMIAKFYEALDSGNEMPVTAESASYALKILLAAYRSGDEFITI